MSRPSKWDEMVRSSRRAKEDFNNFADDNAIVWADNEMRNYKRAMLILKNAHSDWAMSLSDDDERFVQTMINRAESR
jgi:hypothetical protein